MGYKALFILASRLKYKSTQNQLRSQRYVHGTQYKICKLWCQSQKAQWGNTSNAPVKVTSEITINIRKMLQLNHSLDKPDKTSTAEKFVFTSSNIVTCHLEIQLQFATCIYCLALKPCKLLISCQSCLPISIYTAWGQWVIHALKAKVHVSRLKSCWHLL